MIFYVIKYRDYIDRVLFLFGFGLLKVFFGAVVIRFLGAELFISFAIEGDGLHIRIDFHELC